MDPVIDGEKLPPDENWTDPEHEGRSPERIALTKATRWVIRAVWTALVVLIVGLYLHHIGDGSILNRDDGLYAHVVRTMVEQNQLYAQWFDYHIYRAYPLGLFVMSLVARIFGTDELGLRMTSALGCLGSFILLALWRGESRQMPRFHLYAAALAAAQPLFFTVSQRVLHDGLLCLLVSASLMAYLRGSRRDAHWGWLVTAGVLCGLSSLVKIFAGLFPLSIICLDVLIAERRILKGWVGWTALFCALAVPGAYLFSTLSGRVVAGSLYRRFFVGLPGFEGEARNWLYGFETITGQEGFVGYVLIGLALCGIVHAVRHLNRPRRLFLLWALMATVLLLVNRTRIPSYSLLLVLPLCLLAGDVVEAIERKVSVVRVVGPAFLAVAVLLTALHGSWVHRMGDRVAVFARMQALAPEDALVCTIDFYHSSPVYYSRRRVVYLTEEERALTIMRRTFGEETVPTLGPGEVAQRLNAARHLSCIVFQERWEFLREHVPDVEVITHDPDLAGPPVVLIRR